MRKFSETLIGLVITGAAGCLALAGGAVAYAQTKPPASASAEKAASAIPSDWTCSICPFQYGLRGTARLGLIHVSQGSNKYGEYTGLTRAGGYLQAGFKATYRDKQGHYLYAYGSRLGLQSRRIIVKGGRQGSYELTASYEGIPHYFYQPGETPFHGAGAGSLTLPPGWTAGGSTGQMAALGASLRPVEIQRTRRIERVAARIPRPKSHWSYTVGYQHEMQKGLQVLGGSVVTTSSLLPESIDYTTDQVNASANYAVKLWQLKLAYYGSFFHDSNRSVRWQNPFTPFIPGAGIARIGQAPSNNFNQLSVAGAWSLPGNTRLMSMVAYGRARQDEQFLPVTVNPTLQPGPLPRSSLDGDVITRNYVLRLASTPVRKLELNADYTFDQHQDLTPQALFPQVLTDAYLASALMNYPYSFENRSTKVRAGYRFSRRVRLSIGGEHRNEQQSFQRTSDTRTNSAWVEGRFDAAPHVNVYAKVLGSNRVAPDYVPLSDLLLQENPLLRQYNLGDRHRKQGQLRISYTPVSAVDVSIQWQQNMDHYQDSPMLGLTNSRDTSYTVSLGLQPASAMSLSAYYTEQRILNNQAGSQTFATPDWYGDREDIVHTAGLDGEWRNVFPKWDIGGSVLYQLARGKIAVIQQGVPGRFPDIVERMQGVQLYTRRRLNARLALRLEYAMERYRSNDWQLDNVTPSTIPNVLTLGLQSPNYTVNLVALSVEYVF